MTAFVAVVALMVLAAIALLVYPLVGPAPVAAKGEPVPPKAAPLAFALAVAVGLGAVAVYSQVNNFPWDNPTTAQPLPPGHEGLGTGGSMDEVAATLEARLQKEPNDLEGWRMLGRTYLVSGNAAKAASAYEKANSISPQKDMGLLLDLAEALVLTDDPAAQPRAKAIIDEALADDADNQKALWYQGVMAVRAGDNETAKRNWSKLLDANPPPEIREVIASQLRELGVDVPAGPGAGPVAPAMAANGAAPPGAGMGGGAWVVAWAARSRRKAAPFASAVKIDPSIAVQAPAWRAVVRRCA